MESRRIPIHTGFYIQIKNGKAVNPGGNDQEAIGFVEAWMTENPSHPDIFGAETWLDLKRKEVYEMQELHRMRAKRAEIDRRVEKAARESKNKDKELIALVREAAREKHGIATEE
jgi:hypothetical protein